MSFSEFSVEVNQQESIAKSRLLVSTRRIQILYYIIILLDTLLTINGVFKERRSYHWAESKADL